MATKHYTFAELNAMKRGDMLALAQKLGIEMDIATTGKGALGDAILAKQAELIAAGQKTLGMKLEDMPGAILQGLPIRQRGWVPGLRLRWKVAEGWQASVDNGPWQNTNLQPNPLYMFKDDWEICE